MRNFYKRCTSNVGLCDAHVFKHFLAVLASPRLRAWRVGVYLDLNASLIAIPPYLLFSRSCHLPLENIWLFLLGHLGGYAGHSNCTPNRTMSAQDIVFMTQTCSDRINNVTVIVDACIIADSCKSDV
jgi:hypothetical protein